MTPLKPYPAYYPVRYDYVPQLPEGWKLLPNIAIFQERIERGHEEAELLSVTIGRGVIKQSELEKKDSSTLDKSKYLLVHPGDLVYSMRFRQGASGFSVYRGIVSPACTVLKPKKGTVINPKFFFYLFRTGFYKNYVERFSYGIADGQIPLRYLDFKRIYSIVPPLSAQNAIVAYLDRKTKQIQEFIQKKERLIELLEERKNAVISTYFKRNNFKVIPLKYKISKIGSGVTPLGGANTYERDGVMFLRSQNVHFDGLRVDDVAYILSKTHAKMKSSQVKENDVLLNITGASIGRCCVFNKKAEANVNQHVCIIRLKNNFNSEFLSLYLSTQEIQDLIRSSQDGASREGLPLGLIKKFLIPDLKFKVQQDVIDEINKERAEAILIIQKATREIEKAKEYQDSLITQVVTGQLKVPELENEALTI